LNRKKNPIKLIKILKKSVGSVRFRFYKQKTEPNRTETETEKNRARPSQTGKTESNRFEPVFILKN